MVYRKAIGNNVFGLKTRPNTTRMPPPRMQVGNGKAWNWIKKTGLKLGRTTNKVMDVVKSSPVLNAVAKNVYNMTKEQLIKPILGDTTDNIENLVKNIAQGKNIPKSIVGEIQNLGGNKQISDASKAKLSSLVKGAGMPSRKIMQGKGNIIKTQEVQKPGSIISNVN